MKQATILLIWVGFFSCVLDAMDGSEYLELKTIALDASDSESEEYPTQSITTMWQGGVRTENRVLNLSKKNLTTVTDLAQYRKSLELATLATLDLCHNRLKSNDLYTILREIPTLTFLCMRCNQIKTVKEIPTHEKLETLLLNDNKLADFDVNNVLTQLPALRQIALHNNRLMPNTITGIIGSHPKIEELWFDHVALTPAQITAFIAACPQLSSELYAGSRTVQKYYSTIKQQYDDHDDGDKCCGYTQPTDNVWCNPCSYLLMPLAGAFIGLITASIISTVQHPHAKQEEMDAFGYYCAILIPTCAISFLLTYRLMYRLCCYLKTKPEDRYKTVYTRTITVQPRLLDLIEDTIEQVPAQEDVDA